MYIILFYNVHMFYRFLDFFELVCVLISFIFFFFFFLLCFFYFFFFFFSSRRRHTRSKRDWSSDVCSSDLNELGHVGGARPTYIQFAICVVGVLGLSIPGRAL